MAEVRIIGISDLGIDEIRNEIERGGRFVVFSYAISLIVVTLQNRSNVYFIKGGGSAFSPGLKYVLATMVLGWWGFPWGPIRSVQSLYINCRGGRTVTREALEFLTGRQSTRNRTRPAPGSR